VNSAYATSLAPSDGRIAVMLPAGPLDEGDPAPGEALERVELGRVDLVAQVAGDRWHAGRRVG
jgi:hypothetical protein